MSFTENIAGQPIGELSRHCAEQTDLFFRKQPYRTDWCYELFRRAIVERNQEAWEAIYRQYYNQVLGWTLRHSQLERTGEEAGFYVNRAFERFWQGLKPENFHNYHDLAALLGYLQMCVHSAIITTLRTSEAQLVKTSLETTNGTPLSTNPEDEALARASASEIWKIVQQVCENDSEWAVAYSTYALGMAPRQICARYPKYIADAKQVNDIKRRLEARLARHPAMRAIMVRCKN